MIAMVEKPNPSSICASKPTCKECYCGGLYINSPGVGCISQES